MKRGDMYQVLTAGPAAAVQRGAVIDHFRRLGLAHPVWRDCRLAVAAALLDVGRAGLVTDLTGGQAAELIRTLSHFRDMRDLAVHLAWTVNQERSERMTDGEPAAPGLLSGRRRLPAHQPVPES